jgi:hypothetical protein
MGVFTAGKTHHNPITVLDHAKRLDRPTHVPAQSLLQFVEVNPLTS